jgi:chromosome segregation ATPase
MKSAKPTAPNEAVDAPPPALLELLQHRENIGSVKERAFSDLKRISRTLVGLTLLSDDLGEAASIDEAMVKVRYERDKLVAECDTLTATIANSQAEAKSLADQNAALGSQVAQVTERVAELDREERRLRPTVESYKSIESAIAASQQRLVELQAEEARLKPIVSKFREIERKLPLEQQQLAEIRQQLSRIRENIV